MEKNEEWLGPSGARDGIERYAENAARRFRLTGQILQGIREGNLYLAEKSLQERNQLPLQGNLQDELTEWKYDLVVLMALMNQVLQGQGMECLILDSIHMRYIQRINVLESVEDCKKMGEEMVQEYCLLCDKGQKKNYPIVVQKVILAVDMDVSQSLTLKDFSRQLNVNSAYLSGLFKRELGVTLTEYVTDRRIRHAKNLLLTSQSPVKAVAKQVGIPDVQYFCRLFKRKVGITPARFREQRGEL